MSALASVPLQQSLALLDFSLRSVCNMRITSGQVRRLLDRCAETAEDLQQIDPYLLRSHRAHALIATVAACLEWCAAYTRKYTVTRFLCSAAYRERFQRMHRRLTDDFTAFTQSVQLTQPLTEWRKTAAAPARDLLEFSSPPHALDELHSLEPAPYAKNSIS